LSKTTSWRVAVWCSDVCFIWARSTTLNNWPGANPSRCFRSRSRTARPPRPLCFETTLRLRPLWGAQEIVQLRLRELKLVRPRQWGAYLLALHPYCLQVTLGRRLRDLGPSPAPLRSPDGRRIAHVMDNSVCVTDATTGETSRLTPRSGGETPPSPWPARFP
jgi:hypothetical protein